jgi:CBS domain-containing protein
MMSESDLNQVPVVDGRRLAGIVARGDILRLIQMRQAVGIADAPRDENPGSTPDTPST